MGGWKPQKVVKGRDEGRKDLWVWTADACKKSSKWVGEDGWEGVKYKGPLNPQKEHFKSKRTQGP